MISLCQVFWDALGLCHFLIFNKSSSLNVEGALIFLYPFFQASLQIRKKSIYQPPILVFDL